MKQRLLFVEDEIDLGNVVKQYLEIMGFEVYWFKTAESAYEVYCDQKHFDLLLIDIQLPGSNGFELAEKVIRIDKYQPFLFLTARNEKKDRLQGLKLGADDYINKPFDIDELVLRIKNILRRHNVVVDPIQATKTTEEELFIGDVLFKRDLLKLIFPNNKEVQLTLREAELLEYLYLYSNRILKREDILMKLWGENDYFMGRSLDVFVSRLRKALLHSSEVRIENVYGVGFIFRIPKQP